jgi:cell fate regulator YaaT (PSP1 superfamily)
MAEFVLVKFKPYGRVCDFEVDGVSVKKGDLVVIESELGLTIGKAISDPRPVSDDKKRLKKILRIATDEDIKQKEENMQLEKEAKEFCLERIIARGLPMKLITTEVTLDKKRIIFYFNAEKRIDFRELVKDLASRFKTRIEMRQIGVRDGAKIIGSLGICGRELCCKQFLTNFEPISIKMAKKQELVLNTGKLSGSCGRLMCCLSYEYSESYEYFMETDKEIVDNELYEHDELDKDINEEIVFSFEGNEGQQEVEGIKEVVDEQKKVEQSVRKDERIKSDKHRAWPRRKRRKRFYRGKSDN